MVRLNRIYTRTGDDGSTALVDGSRVSKADPRVQAYGTVDETSAQIGLARALLKAHRPVEPAAGAPIDALLGRLQQDLFDLGAQLATPATAEARSPEVGDDHVRALEHALDAHNANLPPLRSFVLPAGHPAAAALHVARTVCRRAERLCAGLKADGERERAALRYLNRLSDLLFVLAREVNRLAGEAEHLWRPGGGSAAGGAAGAPETGGEGPR